MSAPLNEPTQLGQVDKREKITAEYCLYACGHRSAYSSAQARLCNPDPGARIEDLLRVEMLSMLLVTLEMENNPWGLNSKYPKPPRGEGGDDGDNNNHAREMQEELDENENEEYKSGFTVYLSVVPLSGGPSKDSGQKLKDRYVVRGERTYDVVKRMRKIMDSTTHFESNIAGFEVFVVIHNGRTMKRLSKCWSELFQGGAYMRAHFPDKGTLPPPVSRHGFNHDQMHIDPHGIGRHAGLANELGYGRRIKNIHDLQNAVNLIRRDCKFPMIISQNASINSLRMLRSPLGLLSVFHPKLMRRTFQGESLNNADRTIVRVDATFRTSIRWGGLAKVQKLMIDRESVAVTLKRPIPTIRTNVEPKDIEQFSRSLASSVRVILRDVITKNAPLRITNSSAKGKEAASSSSSRPALPYHDDDDDDDDYESDYGDDPIPRRRRHNNKRSLIPRANEKRIAGDEVEYDSEENMESTLELYDIDEDDEGGSELARIADKEAEAILDRRATFDDKLDQSDKAITQIIGEEFKNNTNELFSISREITRAKENYPSIEDTCNELLVLVGHAIQLSRNYALSRANSHFYANLSMMCNSLRRTFEDAHKYISIRRCHLVTDPVDCLQNLFVNENAMGKVVHAFGDLSTAFLVRCASYDVCNPELGLHIHIQMYGPPGSSKSLFIDWITEMRIEGTVVDFQYISDKVFTFTGKDLKHMIITCEEVPVGLFAESGAKRGADSQKSMVNILKKIATACRVSVMVLNLGENGRRELVIADNELVCTFLFATNEPVLNKSTSNAWISRNFLVETHALPLKVLLELQRREENSMDKAVYDKCRDEYRLEQVMFTSLFKDIEMGALSKVGVDVPSLVLPYVNDYIKKNGYIIKTVRFYQRTAILARIVRMWSVLRHNYFSDGGAWQTAVFHHEQLKDIEGQLYITIGDLCLALSYTCASIMPKNERLVHQSIKDLCNNIRLQRNKSVNVQVEMGDLLSYNANDNNGGNSIYYMIIERKEKKKLINLFTTLDSMLGLSDSRGGVSKSIIDKYRTRSMYAYAYTGGVNLRQLKVDGNVPPCEKEIVVVDYESNQIRVLIEWLKRDYKQNTIAVDAITSFLSNHAHQRERSVYFQDSKEIHEKVLSFDNSHKPEYNTRVQSLDDLDEENDEDEYAQDDTVFSASDLLERANYNQAFLNQAEYEAVTLKYDIDEWGARQHYDRHIMFGERDSYGVDEIRQDFYKIVHEKKTIDATHLRELMDEYDLSDHYNPTAWLAENMILRKTSNARNKNYSNLPRTNDFSAVRPPPAKRVNHG